MKRLALTATCCLVGLSTLPPATQAHSDDPKASTPHPTYMGPGYRAAERGTPPLNFPSNNIRLLSWLPCPELNSQASTANSCWAYVSPGGREYAIIGLSNGTAFVDVTDPTNAQVVGFISGPSSLWRDVRVFQNYCYAISEGGDGIQVINLSQIDSGVVTFVRTVTTGGDLATHTLAIDTASGYLFRAGGGSNGLRIYNLNADPSNPSYVTAWSPKYVHECQALTYTSGPNAGKQIVFACGGQNGGYTDTGLDILDVTNKASIQLRKHIIYPDRQFCHQAWVEAGGRYVYMNDELDEGATVSTTTTYIFDVRPDTVDFGSAVYSTSFTNGNSAIGHNLYPHNGKLYAANYRSGVHIYDISSPLAPVEIGYFDTWPEDDLQEFNGLWNVHPYLPSGTFFGSDIEKGLFVWRFGAPQLTFTYPNGLPELIGPTGDTLQVEITASGATLDAASPMLHVDTGSGFVASAMVPLGGGLYNAVFPASTCGQMINFYFSASTTGGDGYEDPAGAPLVSYCATSAFARVVASTDTMETNPNWTVGAAGDTASTGVWTRVDPIGTAAQPEDDHTQPGTLCWVTGQGSPGGSVGENDVDGGKTTLVTRAYNLSAEPDAWIRYWRWYSNSAGAEPGADVFVVDISNNNGSSWTRVETVGPTGAETTGGWIEHALKVSDFVTPTAQIKLRFIAEDAAGGSIIEAAIDDFEVYTLDCTPDACPGDTNGDGRVDNADLQAVLDAWASSTGDPNYDPAADFDGNGQVENVDLQVILDNWANICW
jgi:choice-of-anchor B domain-containing protein